LFYIIIYNSSDSVYFFLSITFYKSNHLLYPLLVCVLIFYAVNEPVFFFFRNRIKDIYKRQCHLLLFDINACRLSYFCSTIIKEIILYLKSHPYKLAKFMHTLYLFPFCVNGLCSHCTASGNKCCGFLPYYFIV